uniref:non-specific serine/threonine protein kinase n=1 Tax=Trichuris muris TaxID=70415 RepID=A0A5S6R209_TRIMR
MIGEEDGDRETHHSALPTPKFNSGANSTWSTKSKERPSQRTAYLLRTPSRFVPAYRLDDPELFAKQPRIVTFKQGFWRPTLPMTHYDSSKSASYFEQCFINRQMIGEGSFGEVYRAECLDDGVAYAVKKSIELFKNTNDRKRKLREVQKYELLPVHPNLVKFIKAWEENGYLYIQTELCERSLTDYLITRSSVDGEVIRPFLVDVLHAVKQLHKRGFVHMDIKPDNIFLTTGGTLKLGDFGLMFNLNGLNEERTEGDSKYLANEALQGKIGKFCDIFSVGVTLLEMCCNVDLPSQGETWQSLRQGSAPLELIDSNVPLEFHQLIRQMLNPSYMERPSVDDLLQARLLCSFSRFRLLYVTYRETLTRTRQWLKSLWFLTTFYVKPLLYRLEQCIPYKAIGIGSKVPRKRACVFSDDEQEVGGSLMTTRSKARKAMHNYFLNEEQDSLLGCISKSPSSDEEGEKIAITSTPKNKTMFLPDASRHRTPGTEMKLMKRLNPAYSSGFKYRSPNNPILNGSVMSASKFARRLEMPDSDDETSMKTSRWKDD